MAEFVRNFKKYIKRIKRYIVNRNQSLPKNAELKFGNEQKCFQISKPYHISNSENIFIGDNVGIGPGSTLNAQCSYPNGWMRHPEGNHIEQTFISRIKIGDRVTATGGLQIVAFKEIIIEDDVMFASNILICDALHGYSKADIPYKYQGITSIEPIRIMRGCWIGQNVVVLPGVTIGEYSIIGANSVVTKNIPNQSIAVGAPARVIKRWNNRTEKWESNRFE
jgi:acetyltransferase-like isoleucine patch superfamily enzyme